MRSAEVSYLPLGIQISVPGLKVVQRMRQSSWWHHSLDGGLGQTCFLHKKIKDRTFWTSKKKSCMKVWRLNGITNHPLKLHLAQLFRGYETCISHCVIGRNKQKEMRVSWLNKLGVVFIKWVDLVSTGFSLSKMEKLWWWHLEKWEWQLLSHQRVFLIFSLQVFFEMKRQPQLPVFSW